MYTTINKTEVLYCIKDHRCLRKRNAPCQCRLQSWRMTFHFVNNRYSKYNIKFDCTGIFTFGKFLYVHPYFPIK